MRPRITVVGAGVVGLTCAVRLAEAGYDVDVLARDLPAETTSAVAGGLWLPYLAEPADRVAAWAGTTYTALAALAGVDRTGVRVLTGHLLLPSPAPPPPWADALGQVVTLTAEQQPAPGFRFGYRLAAPLVDPRRYLPYLTRRLAEAGGTLTRLPLAGLPQRGIVLNCTGLSARALVGDPSVRPVRGQTVLVTDPGLTEWWCAEGPGELSYVLPRGRDVVLGGTAEEDAWSTTPDPATAERILARARSLVPALHDAEVLGHRVGLRPGRPEVRLEVERPASEDPEHAVVHCYGHGGCGLTLSWGCADDVLAAVERLAAAATA